MYAIVKFKGNQYKAEKDKVLKVPYLGDKEVGSELEMNDIYLVSSDQDVQVGNPTLTGAKVVAQILSHKRDKKVIVFKKKRRKGYRKKQGHRQNFTEIKIKEINMQ